MFDGLWSKTDIKIYKRILPSDPVLAMARCSENVEKIGIGIANMRDT